MALRLNYNNHLELESGSKVCIIGGGPAGSFFSYFFLELAERLGLETELEIYEAKNFSAFGPAGCNHCGGIISESLVQLLSAEGITLPGTVVRRGIDSYVMHTDDHKVKIETPLHEKRIASVFRGNGPSSTGETGSESFDKFLLNLCERKGAKIINSKVTEIIFDDDKPLVKTKDGNGKKYDLIVAAVGLENTSLKMLNGANPNFKAPDTAKTYICEFYLGEETVTKHFGDSMHVFLMDIPNLEFGALIPKGNYVTLVLLGSEINKELVINFLSADQVKGCFPEGTDLNKFSVCQCYPKINTKTARFMYGDRFVAVGDSATSKLYKNGIGAAYITGKAAATAALFNGVSSKDFENNYLPACRSLNFDNSIGRIVFLVTKVIKKSSILKRAVIRCILAEQGKSGMQRHMSTVLWDTFTGSAPYKEIFIRTLKPVFLSSLILNSILSLRKRSLEKHLSK
jgi:flavin-dependent dehydrogenase